VSKIDAGKPRSTLPVKVNMGGPNIGGRAKIDAGWVKG
jgi:hypothetical protein